MPARPNGPVLDQAGIIPDVDEAALVQKLTAYNRQSGRALMVVTVNSLDGDDVNSYATELGHRWGVGGKQSDMGAILLVAPTERKLSIQVGYGLEEYLPDVLAYRIINSAVTPRFKQGDYSGGISAGVDEMIAQLNRDPADAKAIAEAAKAASRNESSGGSAIGGAIFWVVLIVVMIGIFGRRRRGYVQRRSGIDPGIVLWGISEIARAASDDRHSGGGWGGGFGSGGGSDSGSWGGFGGGDFGGGGASGDW
ncbi:TPM domain-containing protein [Novosphingobium sp. ERW19]|uniref:TPM domain-containing protein n=1 Tax=Novosphingobium sp. ERW19 TaxID=2726186 RepID=UPI001F0F8BF4|nr:TPM domain-containing protein [Novosphingobium sp. ERW19]